MGKTFNQSLQDKLQFRENFKALSNRLVNAARNAGNVNIKANYVLKVYYHTQGAHNLRSFNDWKRDGFAVKQGSKGFPIWGNLKTATGKDGKEYSYSPILFLFDESQVIKNN